ESSQTPKFENKEQKIEIESEPPTKLPSNQIIDRFLLSPDSKYAVTHSRKSTKEMDFEELICGWQLDQEQTENELHHPISFKLDNLINLREFHINPWRAELVAVSNNKLVAIAVITNMGGIRMTVLNLAIKKEVILKSYPYLDDTYSDDIPDFRAEFYNNEDFVMLQIINNYCLILKDSFKNLHNDKQSWTKLLNNRASTKFDGLMDEKIYYMSAECLWAQKISKKQWIEYLQKRSQDPDKIR
ncbi:36401_t:CDS:2, partial [Racocetra persica]